jgi:hypothetical protein
MKNINHNSQFLGAAIWTWYLEGTKQEWWPFDQNRSHDIEMAITIILIIQF